MVLSAEVEPSGLPVVALAQYKLEATEMDKVSSYAGSRKLLRVYPCLRLAGF